MKRKKGIKGMLGGALAIFLALGLSATAQALSVPLGVDPSDPSQCTINSGAWDHNTGSDGISLRTAIYFANHHEKYDACTGRITLEKDKVKMRTPLVITADGVEIDGNGNELEAKDINASAKTDGLDGKNCAIMIKANDVVIRNLKLTNDSDADHRAICIEGMRNMLDGVEVVNGEYSILFDDGATANRILPNVDLKGASKAAIADHTGEGAGNVVIHTNNLVERDDWGDMVDWNGIVEWAVDDVTGLPLRLSVADMLGDFGNALGSTGLPEMSLELAAHGGKLLDSRSPYIPVITEFIDKKGSAERFQITGVFMRFPGDAFKENGGDQLFGYEPFDCKMGTITPSIRRLAVYTIKSGEMKFAAMVGESKSKGVDSEVGEFDFYIDTNENPEFTNIDSFVLVPVAPDGTLVGRASSFKRLAAGQTDCIAGTAPGGIGSGGGGGGSGAKPGEGKLVAYQSVGECNEDLAFIPGSVENDTDSDLDGIPDYIERSIAWKTDPNDNVRKWIFDPASATCGCDLADNRLSCWYKPDSDSDGVKDGNDGYIVRDWHRFYLIDDPRTRFEDLTDPVAIAERIVTAVNTDGAYTAPGASDTYPDVKDTDSDNDGLKEGEEDRTRVFNERAPAYFYKLDATGQPPYLDSKGERVECDLDDMAYIGVKYGIFIGGGRKGDCDGEDDERCDEGNYLDKPIPYTMFTDTSDLQEDRSVYILECRNETVRSDKDFNGIHDRDRGETDARDPDTDDDCVCDGFKLGCAEIDNMNSIITGGSCLAAHNNTPTRDNPAWLNDNCPETPQPTNQCSPSCIEGEILMPVKAVAPEYVEGSGSNLRLVDDNRNGVPDLFERKVTDPETGIERPDWEFVDIACADTDKDGIPDCVERKEANCAPTSINDREFDPYNKDTDGDGLADGIGGGSKADVCPLDPAEAGRSDEFNGTDTGYSCDPRQEVYTSGGNVPKILSCFLDRDNDGLRDCEEDRDMDGYVAPPLRVQENGILLSESDPLAVDTDSDLVGDFDEVRGWPYRTHPNLEDTDEDGLMDGEEDRDSDGRIVITILEGQGCQDALIDASGARRDTDPRTPDTDGDGLNDKLELEGQDIDRDDFLRMIGDPMVWTEGGIPHISNPLAQDSDGDGLTDPEEYDGMYIEYYGSNPCMPDSDGDGDRDDMEEPGCRLNPHPTCEGGIGLDSDSDGLTDRCEQKLGTFVNQEDSDGDGVKDGDEDVNHNCIYEPHLAESNPMNPDTDGDALNDGLEFRYGSDPTNIDTDGDCIPDGVEDANLNGYFDMGSETDATSADTDEDGLPDGFVARSGMGEDINCNGIRDVDASGVFTETDPRNPDSDMDGYTDYEEMMHGGYYNITNIGRATQGREGCQMVAGSSVAPTSMYYLFGLILVATRLAARRMRKRPCLRRRDRE
jgi:hypothetical protein